jgi:hypothetical protein
VVYISTSTGDEFLDVGDFVLLFVVCFDLICFEFFFCTDVGVVVSTVVHEFAIDGKIHDLRADIVEEILRMGGEDETMGIFREISFEPDHRFEIEMVGRFVQQQQKWLNEQCLA